LDTTISFQIEVINGCSILAAVGLRMASTPGVSAILFDALAKVFTVSNLVRSVVPLMLLFLPEIMDAGKH
jgi:aspartokinase